MVVIAVGAWMFTKDDNTSSSSGNTEVLENNTVSEETPENFAGSVSQLLALNKNIKCTFNRDDSGMTMKGTFYIAGKDKKVRGDFSMSGQGQAFDGSTIQRDDMVYTWGETPFGKFATKVDVGEKKKKSGKGIDFDDEMNFKCSKWQVDNDKFELPEDVTFEDINPQVKKIDETMQQVNDIKCGACDSIPDENGKAQCRVALGC